MARCRSCSSENPDRNHFCGVCGEALGSASELPTDAMPRTTSTPSGSGTLVAGTATVNVGGTLNVGLNQAAGNYTGTYPVTVNYN